MRPSLCFTVLLGLSCQDALGKCVGASSRLAEDECQAWQSFFDATSGSKWMRCSSTRSDPCTCTEMDDAIHVLCANDTADASVQHIVEISMYGNSLSGSLPVALKNLPKLRLISVLENPISGLIDASLCSLADLEYIRVGGLNVHAPMSGGIPSCLFVKPGIKGIWLRNTQLGGAAPTRFANSLVELGLEGNNLHGRLPALDYSQFTFECNLKNNDFACPLPAGAAEKCEATCEDVSKPLSTTWSCQCASTPNKDLCYTRWRCCTDSSMKNCDESVAWGDKPECKEYCDKKNGSLMLV